MEDSSHALMEGEGGLDVHRRVKLYQLNDSGEWEDKGTGQVCTTTMKANGDKVEDGAGDGECAVLLVKSDDDQRILLQQPVSEGVEYQRQGETIIAWCEASTGTDLALSFQEVARCQEIWEVIMTCPAATRGSADLTAMHNYDELIGNGTVNGSSIVEDTAATIDLPSPSLSTIDKIFDRLSSILIPQRSSVAHFVMLHQQKWLRELFAVFRVAEKECARHALIGIFRIVKFLFNCNVTQLIECLTKKTFIRFTIACLEYDETLLTTTSPPKKNNSIDNLPFPIGLPPWSPILQQSPSSPPPSLPSSSSPHHPHTDEHSKHSSPKSSDNDSDHDSKRDSIGSEKTDFLPSSPTLSDPLPLTFSCPQRRHRDFLRNEKFKIVIDFHDDDTLWKIHHTHYLHYIKDVILLRHLDDAAITHLSQLAYFNNLQIVSKLTDNTRFLADLIALLNKYANINNNNNNNSNNKQNGDLSYKTSNGTSDIHDDESEDIDEDDAFDLLTDLDDIENDETNDFKKDDSNDLNHSSLSDEKSSTISTDSKHSNDSPLRTKRKRSESSDDDYRSVKSRRIISRMRMGVMARQEKVLHNPDIIAVRKQVFLFLQELVAMPKTLQMSIREGLYAKLREKGFIFEVLQNALINNNAANDDGYHIWLSCSDILHSLLTHEPASFRSWIISTNDTHKQEGTEQKNDSSTTIKSSPTLLHRIFEVIVTPNVDSGLLYQLSAILRLIIDPESMAEGEKDSFMTLVYQEHFPQLISFIKRPLVDQMTLSAWNAVYQIIELINFSANHYASCFKPVALKYEIIESIVALMALPRMEIKCAIIRFLRTIVAAHDVDYVNIIVQQKLLDPIIEAFVQNGARYNLLNSVVLDLINAIRVDNGGIVPLIDYLIDHHQDKFSHVNYVTTFKDLLLRYQQIHNKSEEKSDQIEKPLSRGATMVSLALASLSSSYSDERLESFVDDVRALDDEVDRVHAEIKEEFFKNRSEIEKLKRGDDDDDYLDTLKKKPAIDNTNQQKNKLQSNINNSGIKFRIAIKSSDSPTSNSPTSPPPSFPSSPSSPSQHPLSPTPTSPSSPYTRSPSSPPLSSLTVSPLMKRSPSSPSSPSHSGVITSTLSLSAVKEGRDDRS